VSSPNTPGLRALQTESALESILGEVADELGNFKKRPPLYLKLAPEVFQSDATTLLNWLEAQSSLQGLILTNTLAGAQGGTSGAPLRLASRQALAVARNTFRRTLISVGGVDTADEIKIRMTGGAALVQVYTGWVYGGPRWVGELVSGLK
jgi:dihydroorotate dehydrogenase